MGKGVGKGKTGYLTITAGQRTSPMSSHIAFRSGCLSGSRHNASKHIWKIRTSSRFRVVGGGFLHCLTPQRAQGQHLQRRVCDVFCGRVERQEDAFGRVGTFP